ncbi:hypothetical protein EDD11_005829 [Mortierella claussenii]|nr:hypothetical protein EDD11_005829 [Mortierella claussenii]
MTTQEQPTLLVECVVHVLSYLKYNQVPTLCSLLRVNKTFFRLTAPILYQNPFLIVYNRLWSEDEKTWRLAWLLRQFLSEIDPALQKELPPWSTEQDDDEDGYRDDDQIRNRHSILPVVPFTKGTMAKISFLKPCATSDASLAQNLQRGDSQVPFEQHYRAVKDSIHHSLMNNGDTGSMEEGHKDNIERPPSYSAEIGGYFLHYRRQDHSFLAANAIPRVFRTITRIQCQSILGQLDGIFLRHCGSRVQSMCIASIHVQQFSGYIPMLSCLKRLEIHHVKRITPTILDALVEWIQQHNKTHGTLRELQIGGLTGIDDDDMSSMKELVRLPQAFKTLLAFDTRAWSEAWSIVDQIPVEALGRLAMEYGEGQAPTTSVNFFLNCRYLKVLGLFIPAPDTFRGVAKLFRMQQGNEARDIPLDTALTGYGLGIPPVERLYISGDHVNLRNALEDAAVGLSQSLRILKASSLARHSVLKPSLTWGRPLEIHMPFLQELQLQGDIALEFHFSLLRCCPHLTVLKLMVNGMESCGQENNPLDEILGLKKLQTLQLLGRWPLSLTFVEGIAYNLTGLKILDLARCFGVSLGQVMETVYSMAFLWRVGWDMEEETDADLLLKQWKEWAPKVKIGFIHWNEFLV